MDDCLESDIECDDECDVCFCESDPKLGIKKCQDIGNDCCNNPYGESVDILLRGYLSYPPSPLLTNNYLGLSIYTRIGTPQDRSTTRT